MNHIPTKMTVLTSSIYTICKSWHMTSFWRHFRVWDHKWRHCDVIFCRKNLKKIHGASWDQELSEMCQRISCSSSRKKSYSNFKCSKIEKVLWMSAGDLLLAPIFPKVGHQKCWNFFLNVGLEWKNDHLSLGDPRFSHFGAIKKIG